MHACMPAGCRPSIEAIQEQLKLMVGAPDASSGARAWQEFEAEGKGGMTGYFNQGLRILDTHSGDSDLDPRKAHTVATLSAKNPRVQLDRLKRWRPQHLTACFLQCAHICKKMGNVSEEMVWNDCSDTFNLMGQCCCLVIASVQGISYCESAASMLAQWSNNACACQGSVVSVVQAFRWISQPAHAHFGHVRSLASLRPMYCAASCSTDIAGYEHVLCSA